MGFEWNGEIVGVLRDHGRIVSVHYATNFLTDDGLKHIAARLEATPSQGAMTHMAIGTGNAQTKTSTTLETEVARVAFTSGYPQVDSSPLNRVLYVAYYAAGTGTGVISEAACFNNATPGLGNMLNYWLFNPTIDKQAANDLTVTLRVLIGALSA